MDRLTCTSYGPHPHVLNRVDVDSRRSGTEGDQRASTLADAWPREPQTQAVKEEAIGPTEPSRPPFRQPRSSCSGLGAAEAAGCLRPTPGMPWTPRRSHSEEQVGW